MARDEETEKVHDGSLDPLSDLESADREATSDPDTVQVVAHALSLPGSERRSYLHQQAGQDTARYEQLVRLVRWSELHPAGHPFDNGKRPGGRKGSTRVDSPAQLEIAWNHVLELLKSLGPRTTALEPRSRIAEGGMGEIREAWDPVLRRTVVIKSLRKEEFPDPKVFDFRHHAALLRFVEEARITGQLDHPSIVPVHSLGLDAEGHMYFAMQRVRGQDLSAIYDSMRAGNKEWTQSRVLGVFQKVCEAMAYAHSKGVVHRDIKPANIMVGRFGEVHVLDWGVARIIGDENERRSELRQTGPITRTRIGQREETDAVLTQDGDILGTPAYMSPEQAEGRLSDLGPRSDVYSVGAMLYHLLAGKAPYGEESLRPVEILARISEAAPLPLERLAKHIPAELISICNKSMARQPSERYRDMGEMARDLTAFLDERVVRAHKVGALTELRKWIRRNRLFAASIAAFLLVIASAIILVAVTEKSRAHEIQRSADMDGIERLNAAFSNLGPVGTEGVDARKAWISETQELLARVPDYEQELADLRLRGTPRQDPLDGLPKLERASLDDTAFYIQDRAKKIQDEQERLETEELTPEEGERLERDLAFMEPNLSDLKKDYERRLKRAQNAFTHVFANRALQERHDRLVRFLEIADRLDRPGDGLIAKAEREIERGQDLEQETVVHHRPEWGEAIATIADRDVCPEYRGLTLAPIPGLVPLGLDFESGLYEFWHVLSGTEPERDDDGRFLIGEQEGMVFVLVPSGPSEVFIPNRQGTTTRLEGELDAFFLSKFEMTQEQWLRLTGMNPSKFKLGDDSLGDGLCFPGHPVESVAWSEAEFELPRWNLALPTSLQWLKAATGGPGGSVWRRDDIQTRQNINVAKPPQNNPRSAGDPTPPNQGDLDGSTLHAKVGSYAPNPLGFFEILGNVAELCSDWYVYVPEDVKIRAHDGRMEATGYKREKYVRGGSYQNPFLMAQPQATNRIQPTIRRDSAGLRPVFLPPNNSPSPSK